MHPPPLSTILSPRSAQLMQKAQELETRFLSEMLAHTGLDAQTGGFNGGIGEDQFASFLRESQAKAMVDRGGLGLAQSIFQSLVRRDDPAT
jgi:flagellar protein FlgJ